MRSTTPSSESYAPFSRGFRKHLAEMSGNAVKLYVELLLAADFAGPRKGQVAATFAELAARLKMHRTTVYKAARKLRPRYITWEGAKNQLDTTIFTIQKYKAVEDFACSRRATSGETAGERRGNGRGTALPATGSEHRELPTPKKFNNKENKGLSPSDEKIYAHFGVSVGASE